MVYHISYMGHEVLIKKLDAIQKVFSIDEIMRVSADSTYIRHYYKVNKYMYSLFHTRTDFVHMGISRSGVYKEEDLHEQAKIVEEYIPRGSGVVVLELATGRGLNSCYMSNRLPSAAFYGIDLSPTQLALAKKKARLCKNFFPLLGDYHNLSYFADASCDVVFVIEALCHSTEKEEVVSEVWRVLKPGGVFIVIDGYRVVPQMELSDVERTTEIAIEKGMSVEAFEVYNLFCSTVRRLGFELLHEEDVSQYVIPSMERLEKIAALFFGHPWLARLAAAFLPRAVAYNSVAAYLMPEAMRQRLFCYMITVFKKPLVAD